MKALGTPGWERVYRVVRRIPAGRVASYGQIAALAGMPRAARQVGYALHALTADSDVPWHRVVNAAGRISVRGDSAIPGLQRARLEAEGIGFDAGGRIDWERVGWRPRASVAARTGAARPKSSKRTAAVRSSRGSQK